VKIIAFASVLILLLVTAGFAQPKQDFTDVEFYGYKVTHHMGAMIQHIEKYGA
jgi:hypothetical protein